MRLRFAILLAALGLPGPAQAADPASSDAPVVPATRFEMKQILEDSKRSQPRLPLPPLTEEEKTKAGEGEWGIVNNARMRRHYLPPELVESGLTRDTEPSMTLGYPFQTMLFWIVSRSNNCTYCMGHQESKLAASGLVEERIAALDGDWSEFEEAQRAAFGFARKLTFEPHAIGDADLEGLRRHYDDRQVLEVLLVASNFNAMNRWTGALKIPQEEHRVYLSPTPARYSSLRSLVAPLAPSPSGSAPACAAPSRRPPLESPAEVEAALSSCRSRTPRLPLVGEDQARALLPPDWPAGPLPQWVRLLATFPKAGATRIALHRAAEQKGTLDRRLRAEVAYVAARQDRAWYALGHARWRLASLGRSAEEIAALDGTWDTFDPAERLALALARKLTVDPALVTDADVATLREHFTDHQVAELTYQVTEAAFFDRVTEAAGLGLEPWTANPGRAGL